MKLLLAGIALSALAVPLMAQRVVTHEATSEAAPIDSTTQADELAFRDDLHERMTVPVRVAGYGPYRFIVDTGADRTAISREVATRLNLEEGPAASMHSVSGRDMVETAQVPILELSRKKVASFDAPVLERRHMGADGILGVDSLRSQRIVFDFKANLLSIVPSESYTARYPDEIVVRARNRRGHLILTDAQANGRRVEVVVDTGAEVSIGNEALRERLGIRIPPGSEGVPILSVSGDVIRGHYAVIRRLKMGGVTLRDLPVVFADAHTFRKLRLRDKPTLLLGMNGMKAFDKVSIDFAQRKFRVLLPQSSGLDDAAMASRTAP